MPWLKKKILKTRKKEGEKEKWKERKKRRKKEKSLMHTLRELKDTDFFGAYHGLGAVG